MLLSRGQAKPCGLKTPEGRVTKAVAVKFISLHSFLSKNCLLSSHTGANGPAGT